MAAMEILDPVSIAGGIWGSYFDPMQLVFALVAAAFGWARQPLPVTMLAGLYIAIKTVALGALWLHVAVVDALFIFLNAGIGWLLGLMIERLSPNRRT